MKKKEINLTCDYTSQKNKIINLMAFPYLSSNLITKLIKEKSENDSRTVDLKARYTVILQRVKEIIFFVEIYKIIVPKLYFQNMKTLKNLRKMELCLKQIIIIIIKMYMQIKYF